jgi:guanine nucleotide-binding protein subunit alpha
MSSPDDILRARLKTLGVTEHSFTLDGRNSAVPKEWLIYDVGGSRTQRSAWQPYFDSANAIIFIVSISAFDETLAEDPSMNRMVGFLSFSQSLALKLPFSLL